MNCHHLTNPVWTFRKTFAPPVPPLPLPPNAAPARCAIGQWLLEASRIFQECVAAVLGNWHWHRHWQGDALALYEFQHHHSPSCSAQPTESTETTAKPQNVERRTEREWSVSLSPSLQHPLRIGFQTNQQSSSWKPAAGAIN
ncbi:hypothetical protein G7Y89_g3929 [Cudoniella acicularis]|uniref:Uncharacterized protein n=1 Tax=Cudoniella acicularis TaxID=354080 RepID=A0A8H4RSH9_9HELO|nr:hypothetical protein G7Y89_g3929 [Cudoniella acicularis]